MEDFDLRRIINSYIKEICHYSQMQVFATSYYQKNYFQLQIDERVTSLIGAILQNSKKADSEMFNPTDEPAAESRIFTLEELSYYDGSEGKPAYVAVNGVVYDMSMVLRWAGGNHFGLKAGKDFTTQFEGCHQGLVERLENIPKVGLLVE